MFKLVRQEDGFEAFTKHAAKVVDAATEHGVSPQAWADQNAAVFQETFTRLGTTHDDFIRTSQDRHKQRVTQYVRQLMAGGEEEDGLPLQAVEARHDIGHRCRVEMADVRPIVHVVDGSGDVELFVTIVHHVHCT